MLLSLTSLLVLAAFVVTIVAAIGKAPLWIAVLLLTLALALQLGWPR
jgi:hypothetical protein